VLEEAGMGLRHPLFAFVVLGMLIDVDVDFTPGHILWSEITVFVAIPPWAHRCEYPITSSSPSSLGFKRLLS